MGLRSIHDNVCQADVHVTLGPERWGRSTYGLSLGNLTTYPATNCIQGLDPPSFFFFNQCHCSAVRLSLSVRTAREHAGEEEKEEEGYGSFDRRRGSARLSYFQNMPR